MKITELYIGQWWEKSADNRILCKLCPRHCLLSEGQRGFCFVRRKMSEGRWF